MRIMPVWNGPGSDDICTRTAVYSIPVWYTLTLTLQTGCFEYSFSPVKARHSVVEFASLIG